MSTFERETAQETGADKDWDRYVEKLKEFLHRESTETEFFDANGDSYSEAPIEGHPAAQALADVESGDFEAVAVYLDKEIEKTEGDMKAARDDQERLAPLEVRKSTLETLRSGLERQ